jgi:hypothetical protein
VLTDDIIREFAFALSTEQGWEVALFLAVAAKNGSVLLFLAQKQRDSLARVSVIGKTLLSSQNKVG